MSRTSDHLFDALAALKVPGPTSTALSAPFWKAAAEGRVLVQHCDACEANTLYPRQICPVCWSDRLVWREASGRSRLASFSRIHKPGNASWEPVAPYVVGLVTLEEGPTLLSLILGETDKVAVGDKVRMRTTDIGGRHLPAFEII